MNDLNTMMHDGSQISFGASALGLQSAAHLSDLANLYQGTTFGSICGSLSSWLSDSDKAGMDVIKDCVGDLSSFYGVDNVKVFYEKGEPGVHTTGMTTGAFDNWIGGDPQVLSQYANEYGGDFVQNVFAHEMGHYVFDQLGLHQDGYSRLSNEAVADFLAGIYAGSKGLDSEGFRKFLEDQPHDPDGEYPDGEDRAKLFMEGYELAESYDYKNFQSVIDSPYFDLNEAVHDVANRYVC